MTKRETLEAAIQATCQDRQAQHGEAADTFTRIAAVWEGYLKAKGQPVTVTAWDVGHMMTLFKIARSLCNPALDDNYVDAAGYVALTAELAHKDRLVFGHGWQYAGGKCPLPVEDGEAGEFLPMPDPCDCGSVWLEIHMVVDQDESYYECVKCGKRYPMYDERHETNG
jgi:hypothetical protein